MGKWMWARLPNDALGIMKEICVLKGLSSYPPTDGDYP
jgi:hypothetical protein